MDFKKLWGWLIRLPPTKYPIYLRIGDTLHLRQDGKYIGSVKATYPCTIISEEDLREKIQSPLLFIKD